MKLNIGCCLALSCLVLFGAGCGEDSPTAPDLKPTLSISLSDQAINAGDDGSLTIALKDIDSDVFAMSVRIEYNTGILVVREQDAFSLGGWFGADALALLQVEDGVIYLAVTRIASNGSEKASGSVGDIAFHTQGSGQIDFTINHSDVRFIDANGQDVEVPDLAIGEATLVVE